MQKQVLEKFNVNGEFLLRLKAPVECRISGEQVRQLIREYDPAVEKGGIVVANIKTISGKTVLTVEKILIIPNVSNRPHDTYVPDEWQLKYAVMQTFSQNKIPLIFHTHPTIGANFLDELKKYNFQMETSGSDRLAASQNYRFGQYQLRLPEMLVISNGKLKRGLFLGIYGGLIAPHSFMVQRMKVLLTQGVKSITSIWDTLNEDEQGIALVGLPLLTLMAIRENPLVTKRFFENVVEIFKPIAYASEKEYQYFGLSLGNKLTIQIPTPKDEVILKEEAILKSNWRKAV